MTKRIAIILGAGASFGVYNKMSLKPPEVWTPPLAEGLFEQDNQEYISVMARYPGVAKLAPELIATSRNSAASLEAKLRQLADHSNDEIRRHYREVPPYLADLLYNVTRHYRGHVDCYRQLAVKVITMNSYEVLFLVLNYDLLLEAALEQTIRNWKLHSIDDYVNTWGVNVVKIHGSANWYAPMDVRFSANKWEEALEHFDPLKHDLTENIRKILPDKAELERGPGGIRIQDHYCYPVLTAPLAGKEPNDIVCPHDHRTAAENFLAETTKFLFVGTSGLDDDLLYLLHANVKRADRVEIVGSGENVAETETRVREAVYAFKNSRTVKTHSDGFAGYMERTHLLDELLE